MSKMAAVDAAVRQQIASDRKTINYNDKMNVAPAAGAAAPAGYTDDGEFGRFLLGVASRLKVDTPSYLFDWSGLPLDSTRDRELLFVISLVAEKTSAAQAEASAVTAKSA
jgi:hypothetical protein